jgi:hypothetical protein
MSSIYQNVKEHAPLSARASVDHGVEVETTGEHVNRAADRGCCVSACSAILLSEFDGCLECGHWLLMVEMICTTGSTMLATALSASRNWNPMQTG